MLRSRKSLLIAAGLAVFAVAATVLVYSGYLRSGFAGASPATELLSEVPAGAPTLVYLDLAAIRASSFYQHRPDQTPLTLPDSDYAKFVQATGFDFEKDLDQVAIASWPQSLSQEQKSTVAVADGRFDRQKIRDYAVKNGKLDHQQGREVFLFQTRQPAGAGSTKSSTESTWTSLVFLDDHRIAMVEGSSIAPIFESRGASSAADPMRERAARVNGAAAFVVSRAPAVPDNFAPGGMQSTQLATLLRSVQWVTLAARPEGENLRVSLEGECLTDTDARQLQSTIETLRMFGQAALEGSKTRQSMDPAAFGVLDNLLKTADVKATAERVRILVEVTPDVLKLGSKQKQAAGEEDRGKSSDPKKSIR
jgi:hypothetical protein